MLIPAPDPHLRDDRGPIGTAFFAYKMLWASWRAFVTALAPLIVPALITGIIIRLLMDGDNATIVNGELVFPAAPWPLLVAAGWVWAWAVSVGVIVAAGVLRNMRVPARTAWIAALRSLLPIGFVVFFLTSALRLIHFSPHFLYVTVLLVAAVVAARLLLVVPNWLLDGRQLTWALSRGRVITSAGAVIVGVALLPVAVLWLTEKIGALVLGFFPSIIVATLVHLLSTVVIVIIAAGQAATLALVYLLRRTEGTNKAEAVTDLGAVDAFLTARAARPARLVWPWVVALALPTLFATTITVLKPGGMPNVTVHEKTFYGTVIGIGWPDGQHPVLLSHSSFYDCHDDTCGSGTEHHASLTGMDESMVGVTAGGLVVGARVDRPGLSDAITLTTCTRTGDCESGRLTVPRTGLPPLPAAGVGGGTDGSILVAVAQQSDESTVELSLTRCADAACASPRRVVLATIETALLYKHYGNDKLQPVQVRVDGDGRPYLTFILEYSSVLATCDPVTCANPRIVGHWRTGPFTAYAPVDGLEAGIATWTNRTSTESTLRYCKGDQQCAEVVLEGAGADVSGTLAINDQGLFATTIVPAHDEEGWLVIWHCADTVCAHPRKIPLHRAASTRDVHMAVSEHGQVLVVQEAAHATHIIHWARYDVVR